LGCFSVAAGFSLRRFTHPKGCGYIGYHHP
jgi:hypothetical protein